MALSKVDLERCRDEQYIIEPFDDDLLTPLGYDLSPGYVVLVPEKPGEEAEVLFQSSDTAPDTPEKTSFKIPGHRGVMLITRENVCLTGKLLATLHGRSRVTQEGVVVNPVTVDPNWSGRLILYFYNTSKREVEVSTKRGVATLIFHSVESMTTDKPGSSTTKALLTNSRLDKRIQQKLLKYVEGLTNTAAEESYQKDAAELQRKFHVEAATKPPRLERIKYYVGRRIFHRRSWFEVGVMLLVALALGFGIPVVLPDISPEFRDRLDSALIFLSVLVAVIMYRIFRK